MKKATLKKYLSAPDAERNRAPQLAKSVDADRIDKSGGNGRFGAKGGAGVWQSIINQIPPHETFIEAFAGTATITRRKRPAAASTIVIDSDADVCEALTAVFGDGIRVTRGLMPASAAGVTVICGDAVGWLEKHRGGFTRHTVIYCDPPYLFSVRSGRRRPRFGNEFGEEWLHGELLALLSRIACQEVPVLISGYRSALYDRMIGHWRRVDYRTMSHGGLRVESLWCSFDEPAELHDYRYAGINFRERERLKRKRTRWLARLQGMCPRERAVLIAAIDEWRRQASSESAMHAAIS